jgi:riboflavin synthase
MVQGHVDEVGRVKRVEQHPGYRSLAVEVKRESSGLLAAKGSVCVDGVSLTAASARPSEFSVNIIPHTCEATTLGLLHAGERVNIEYDMLVKAAQASR